MEVTNTVRNFYCAANKCKASVHVRTFRPSCHSRGAPGRLPPSAAERNSRRQACAHDTLRASTVRSGSNVDALRAVRLALAGPTTVKRQEIEREPLTA
jgi:hypothetical protein